MRKLLIQTDKGKTVLEAEAADTFCVMNIGYTDTESWHGIYLTRKKATKLRDWLDQWLESSDEKCPTAPLSTTARIP